MAVSIASAQVRPPNYSPDAIPETSFTCEDKITGGYYADQEADCQLFHVCVQVSEYEVRIRFNLAKQSKKLFWGVASGLLWDKIVFGDFNAYMTRIYYS